MQRRALGVAVLVAACIAPPRAAFGQLALTRADSAAIVRAVWGAAVPPGAPRAGQVLWLWAPAAADTARVLPLSAALRDALVRQGIPASARRPAGDDTVVFRLTG
ncbi:hypothetical protein, partial [Luteibacter sp.]|uniref:hypothetical protein n=1 Tax=Luteibacter sp. TaxID=1886636 RepID=UPI003F7D3CC2